MPLGPNIMQEIRGSLFITSFPGAALVLLADYSLYEGIKYIRNVNELQINVDQFTDITVEKQNGVRPATVEFSIFQDVTHQINITVCLPVGTKPDPHQYIGNLTVKLFPSTLAIILEQPIAQ